MYRIEPRIDESQKEQEEYLEEESYQNPNDQMENSQSLERNAEEIERELLKK